ncbi:O-antigen polymerase [Micromonospora sp. C95]|uniref:O-antigen polymerase n=1 Tax=Micromonospora sp. C95 TaxID=2824882 RepID=UPI001B38880F|nr:O-antigen polymerase [Micromonospora sp. C95]MBQ1024157.1 oligosaccharide repeat unit polymerase [Micromonospora sp. C95]
MMLAFSLVVFVPLAVCARLLAGSLLRPVAAFPAFWLAAVVVPVMYFGDEWGITRHALSYLALGTALFSIGAFISSGRQRATAAVNIDQPGRKFVVRGSALAATAIAGIVAGVAASLYEMKRSDVSPESLLSIDGIFNMGNTIALDRYARLAVESGLTSASSAPSSVLLGIVYIGAVVSPFLLLTQLRFRRWLIAGQLLSMLLYTTVTTSRGPLHFGVCLAGSAYVAVYVLRKGDVPRIGIRRLMALIGAVGVVAVIYMGVAVIRTGDVDSSTGLTIQGKLTAYTLGHVPAFSQWLEIYDSSAEPEREPGWGTASIAGVGILTGQDRYALRGYDEYVQLNERGTTTNVSTMYRGLIVDFGYPGALGVIFLFGLATGAAYQQAARRGSGAAAATLACCYTTILWSYGMSTLTWTNTTVAMAAGIAIVGWAVRPRSAMKRLGPTASASGITSAPATVLVNTR